MADPKSETTVPEAALAALRAIDVGGSWCAYAPSVVGQHMHDLRALGLVTIRRAHGDDFVARTAAGDARAATG